MVVDFVDSLISRNSGADTPVLHLFGGPLVTMGNRQLEVPEGSKRLLVFLALHPGRVERRYAAAALWPVGDDLRAAGSLRSALWRLRRAGVHLIAADQRSLAIRDEVVVDIHLVTAWATRVIGGSPTRDDLGVLPWGVDALDLLPGWYDEWALVERERVRQQLLHALERLSCELVRLRRCAEAVEAAMMAVSVEPLRESAQRTLIQAHLAEGNWAESRRSFEAYRAVLHRELGVEPNPELAAAVRRPARAV